MIVSEGKLKPWGNSYGIIVPKEKVKAEGLEPYQNVKYTITPVKRLKIKDIYGILKGKIKRPTQKDWAEIDRELDSKYFRDEK